MVRVAPLTIFFISIIVKFHFQLNYTFIRGSVRVSRVGFMIMLGLGFRVGVCTFAGYKLSDNVCLRNRIKNGIMLPYACLTL